MQLLFGDPASIAYKEAKNRQDLKAFKRLDDSESCGCSECRDLIKCPYCFHVSACHDIDDDDTSLGWGRFMICERCKKKGWSQESFYWENLETIRNFEKT